MDLVKAYCKINLNLHIEDKRFVKKLGVYMHTLNSYTAPINFYDVLRIEENYDGDIVDAKDICSKALNNLREIREFPYIKLEIDKNVPIGAGLGGGSSDAATFVYYLNKKYALGLTEEEIKEISFKTGSDILFCYYCKPAYIKSFGEELEFEENPFKKCYVLLINSGKTISTKKVFEIFDTFNQGSNSNNDLYSSCLNFCPELNDIILDLKSTNPVYLDMTGSGSTCFGIYNTKKELNNAYEQLKDKYPFVLKTKFYKTDRS